MSAEAIVQTFVQGMVDRATELKIPVTKREDKIEFGKIDLPLVEHDSPWIHINPAKEAKCLLWRDAVYNGLVRNLKKSLQFVPTWCQECYKVVVRPETCEDMLKLEEAMQATGWPSKIGIERRPFIPALYGAYFYNRGLEAGRRRLDQIQRMFMEIIFLSHPRKGISVTHIYLKRGCTEMEMEQGPSDKWRISIFQTQVEPLIEQLIYTPEQPDQTEEEKTEIRKKWAAFAWKWDRSYTGPSMQKDCVRY